MARSHRARQEGKIDEEKLISRIKRIARKLSKRLQKYSRLIEKSEAMTRYLLVDPFLRELGWNLENPCEVLVEPEFSLKEKYRPDYALVYKGMIVAYIETKNLSEMPNEEKVYSVLKEGKEKYSDIGVSIIVLTIW